MKKKKIKIEIVKEGIVIRKSKAIVPTDILHTVCSLIMVLEDTSSISIDDILNDVREETLLLNKSTKCTKLTDDDVASEASTKDLIQKSLDKMKAEGKTSETVKASLSKEDLDKIKEAIDIISK